MCIFDDQDEQSPEKNGFFPEDNLLSFEEKIILICGISIGKNVFSRSCFYNY